MAKRSKKRKASSGGVSQKVAAAETVGQQAPSWMHRDWLWGLLLLVAVVVTYSPVWWAGYVWDDDGRLTENPCIVGPLGLKEIWTTSAADLCPLVYTTFWVEHALWGLRALPYHLVNGLLHGACAILLWRILRSLLVPGAWLGAALWALHPVQVETAAWITEMKNTQSCLFYLLTIFFFVRGLRDRASGNRSGDARNYGLTLLCGVLAMTSKSSTVILPIVLGLCAWWVEGRWNWRNLARLWPFALMSVFPSALTLWTQKLLAAPDGRFFVRSLPERLVTAGDAVWFYMGKLLWPHPLIFIYPRWQVDATLWYSWLPLLAVVITLLILWLRRQTWLRPYFFTFAYFVAALLPVLGLVDGYFWRYSLVGDHFQYLASMGPLALAGAGLTRFSDSIFASRPILQFCLCAGLLLTLGTLSWQRTWVFSSQDALWADTLAQNPSCSSAQNNFGLLLAQKGQVDEGIAHFQRALEIDPNVAEAHFNLGFYLARKGQTDEAITHFQRALEINPSIAEAHFKLGLYLARKGQTDEAITHFRRALEINPDNAEAHYNLGAALILKGQLDEAMFQVKEALRLKPDFSLAQNCLAKVQAMMRQAPSANK